MNPLMEARYARERDRILDEATVALLRASSPFAALARADQEERSGVPVYDTVAGVEYDPRATVVHCGFCGRRIVRLFRERRYCDDACRANAGYHRGHPEGRSHRLAAEAVA